MNAQEFRALAQQALDFIVDYTENIREREVLPKVEQGYLVQLLPKEAPHDPEPWTSIMPDLNNFIMPGVTHWISPMFSAYYPVGQSYPSIIGELLSAGIGCVGFNWKTSPSCTELEVIVVDWLAKMLGLPEHFLASTPGPGGGIIQTSASEGIFVALLVAKESAVKREVGEDTDFMAQGIARAKLVAYSSDQSNSAIEKAGRLGSVKTRLLPADSDGKLPAEVLQRAIKEDKEAGLLPCFVVATLGTTATCSFDDLTTLGPVCAEHGLWLHVDAAYAGAAFVCPEYRHLMEGIEYADSISMNPHKWFLVNFDCSVMWIKDRRNLVDLFSVDRIYLNDRTEIQDSIAPDFRNWEISLGRRFRALKLWLVLRLYGVSGLQNYIRTHCSLAVKFSEYIEAHPNFNLVKPASMGVVIFDFKGDKNLTKELLQRINSRRDLYMVAATKGEEYFLRYVINSRIVEQSDLSKAWDIIKEEANKLLEEAELYLSTTESKPLPRGPKLKKDSEDDKTEELICKGVPDMKPSTNITWRHTVKPSKTPSQA